MKKLNYRIVIVAGLLSLCSVAQAEKVDSVADASAPKDSKVIKNAAGKHKPASGATGQSRRRGTATVEDMRTRTKDKKVKGKKTGPSSPSPYTEKKGNAETTWKVEKGEK